MSTINDAADRWRRIIEQQQASGLSVPVFCQQAGLAPSSFYGWRHKLRDQAVFAEVKVAAARSEKRAEHRVVAAGMKDRSPRVGGAGGEAKIGLIELRLRDGRRVVVRPGFDRQTLIDLLAVLEMLPAAPAAYAAEPRSGQSGPAESRRRS